MENADMTVLPYGIVRQDSRNGQSTWTSDNDYTVATVFKTLDGKQYNAAILPPGAPGINLGRFNVASNAIKAVESLLPYIF